MIITRVKEDKIIKEKNNMVKKAVKGLKNMNLQEIYNHLNDEKFEDVDLYQLYAGQIISKGSIDDALKVLNGAVKDYEEAIANLNQSGSEEEKFYKKDAYDRMLTDIIWRTEGKITFFDRDNASQLDYIKFINITKKHLALTWETGMAFKSVIGSIKLDGGEIDPNALIAYFVNFANYYFGNKDEAFGEVIVNKISTILDNYGAKCVDSDNVELVNKLYNKYRDVELEIDTKYNDILPKITIGDLLQKRIISKLEINKQINTQEERTM